MVSLADSMKMHKGNRCLQIAKMWPQQGPAGLELLLPGNHERRSGFTASGFRTLEEESVNHPSSFRVLLFGLVLIACRPVAQAQLAADWVLYGGKILTADTEDPASFTVSEAVAIFDGKFVVVGTNEAALAAAGPNTRRTDLGGRTVLPGLVETHVHVHNHTRAHQLRNEILPGMTDLGIDWTSKEEGMALRLLPGHTQR